MTLENIFDFKILTDSTSFFWVSAIAGTGLFVIQFALNLFGFGHLDDLDAGSTGDAYSFKWLSKHAVTGFLMMFGWTGITCREEFNLSNSMALMISFVSGLLMIFFTGFIFKSAQSLQSTGNVFRIEDSIGKEAFVYQRIPRDGIGKITLSIQNHTFEIDAISLNHADIDSFTRVQVIKKMDDSTVVVTKI